jgi:ammonia channel protein AmtB
VLGWLSFVPLLIAFSWLGLLYGGRNQVTFQTDILILFLIFAICWLLLGYSLWTSPKQTEEKAFPPDLGMRSDENGS